MMVGFACRGQDTSGAVVRNPDPGYYWMIKGDFPCS